MPATDKTIYGKEKRGLALHVLRAFRLCPLFFFLKIIYLYNCRPPMYERAQGCLDLALSVCIVVSLHEDAFGHENLKLAGSFLSSFVSSG